MTDMDMQRLSCHHVDSGEVPSQKGAYLAAKHKRQSRALHVSNKVSCALFGPPVQLGSFISSNTTGSISSSNKCSSGGVADQGCHCSHLRSASEVHERDNSHHQVCTCMPVSGEGTCASFTKGARVSAAGNIQAKSKKASRRGGKAAAAADAVQTSRPCKQRATVEAWTGRRKEATRKNLAKLYENEE